MIDVLSALLDGEGITLCKPVPLSTCRITRPYLLDRAGIADGTVFLFAIPYLTPEADGGRNLSAYAVPRDYHAFLSELGGRLIPALQARYPENRFALFGDHSPIDELHAAAVSGLGVLGQNRMLITKEYSSFVFLAEIITDRGVCCSAVTPRACIGCGNCRKACPFLGSGEGVCLSELSQKKGTLNETEKRQLLAGGSVWGCDRCQLVCPYTKEARRAGTLYTRIPYFTEQTIPYLSSDTVKRMSDEEFRCRAFSWRGKEVILRNLELFEAQRKEEGSC